jgi:hypothetical protein
VALIALMPVMYVTHVAFQVVHGVLAVVVVELPEPDDAPAATGRPTPRTPTIANAVITRDVFFIGSPFKGTSLRLRRPIVKKM